MAAYCNKLPDLVQDLIYRGADLHATMLNHTPFDYASTLKPYENIKSFSENVQNQLQQLRIDTMAILLRNGATITKRHLNPRLFESQKLEIESNPQLKKAYEEYQTSIVNAIDKNFP